MKYQQAYKSKFTSDGIVKYHKAPLVMKVFSQHQGIEYIEAFAPIAKMNSIRLVLSLGVHFGWKIHQMDVKSVLLHGELSQ